MTPPLASPAFVWLASYFKSGNTWLRLLLECLDLEDGAPIDINALGGHMAIDRASFEDIALVDSTLMTADEIERRRPAVHDAYVHEPKRGLWVKVHDPYSRLPDGSPLLGRSARAAVYLVRDPRDVVISHAFHGGFDLDRAIEILVDGSWFRAPDQLPMYTAGWNGHAESWLRQADVPVHVVRYEDLRADPHLTFRGVLDFLGMPAADEAVARAVRATDFAVLQRQEAERGFRERVPGQARFFRKAKVGEWRDVLSEDQIRTIEIAAGPMMTRLGYAFHTEGQQV